MIRAEPLCSEVEPIKKRVVCQRSEGHDGKHRAVYVEGEGVATMEWHDAAFIRQFLLDAHKGEAK